MSAPEVTGILNELRALDSAQKLEIAVDHGETGCKTPDASSYIGKIWLRRAGRGGGAE